MIKTDRCVRTHEDMLAYITDCNLATVSGMAMKTRRPKYDFKRQCSIAQKMVDWMRDNKIQPYAGNRANDVLAREDQSVINWASQYFPEVGHAAVKKALTGK